MRTLAEFKRAIKTGMEIETIQFQERKWSDEEHAHVGELYTIPLAEKMKGVRYVSHVDTTGFYMKQPEDKTKRGSFCGFPKAADLEYDGSIFSFYDRDSKGEIYQKRTYKIA